MESVWKRREIAQMNPKLKRIIVKQGLMVFFIMSLFLNGCGSSMSGYDKGLEDGREGRDKGILYNINSKYKQGYDDGAQEVYYYNLGCQDKEDGKPPRYPDIPLYMDGYKE